MELIKGAMVANSSAAQVSRVLCSAGTSMFFGSIKVVTVVTSAVEPIWWQLLDMLGKCKKY
jgi:hypothetical protein